MGKRNLWIIRKGQKDKNRLSCGKFGFRLGHKPRELGAEPVSGRLHGHQYHTNWIYRSWDIVDTFRSPWNMEYQSQTKVKPMDTMLFVITCGYFYSSALQCDSNEARRVTKWGCRLLWHTCLQKSIWLKSSVSGPRFGAQFQSSRIY